MSFSEKVIMNGTTWASILSSVRNQTGKSAALVAGQVPAQINSIQKTVEYLYIDGTQATLDENDIVVFTNSGGGSGITPTGTLSISTNGTYNVTNYASANVSVPTGTARTSADLTASGATVTVPAGLYSEQATKSVASGTEGTPVATKGAVSNHAVSVTPSVTNIDGYIAGGTKTGTAVSVSASELVSGSETKTVNGTYDVTNLAELVVNVPQSGSAATLITKNITSNGTYDAEDDNADGYSSVVVNIPSGGNVSFKSGTVIYASNVSGPGVGNTKLLPNIQFSFQPDVFLMWMSKATFDGLASYSNNRIYTLAAFKDFLFAPIYVSSTNGSETIKTTNGYVFYRGTAVAATSGNASGYGINSAYNLINTSTYPTWEVNTDGTISVGRFSSSSWTLLAGTYYYVGLKL